MSTPRRSARLAALAAAKQSLPVPAPAPAPPAPPTAPSPAEHARSFSAAVEDDCAYFASQVQRTTPTISIVIPPRPAEKDKDTVCAHMKVLLTISEHTVKNTDQLIIITELFEYAADSQHLMTHTNFRAMIRKKVAEFKADMARMNLVHPPLTAAMIRITHIADYIDNNN